MAKGKRKGRAKAAGKGRALQTMRAFHNKQHANLRATMPFPRGSMRSVMAPDNGKI